MSIPVPTDALISLVNHYEVCDGGKTVKVDRLALAEVLVYVQLTRPDLAAVEQNETANDLVSDNSQFGVGA